MDAKTKALVERVLELDEEVTAKGCPAPWVTNGYRLYFNGGPHDKGSESFAEFKHDEVDPSVGDLMAEYRTAAPELARRLVEAVEVLRELLDAEVSCGEYVIRAYLDDQDLLARAEKIVGEVKP